MLIVAEVEGQVVDAPAGRRANDLFEVGFRHGMAAEIDQEALSPIDL